MQIGFSISHKNYFSRFIAWFTNSKWSHCFVVICPMGEKDALIAESSMNGGVKFNLLSKYQNNSHRLELVDIGYACDLNDLDSILGIIGYRYGYAQIIGYILARLLRLKTNPFTDDIICSELVYLFLIETSLRDLFISLDPNVVTPQDIYERLKSNG